MIFRKQSSQSNAHSVAGRSILGLLSAVMLSAISLHSHADCPAEAISQMDYVGANHSFLGAPTSGYVSLGEGCSRNYHHGVVLWSAATGANELHGPLLDAHLARGGVFGELGFPTTDVTPVGDTVGSFSIFENSALYYFPGAGAYMVKGLIALKWSFMGGTNSILGYPLSDETIMPDGVGRFNLFQYGAIYDHPIYGTFYLRGPILDQWLQGDPESAYAGYEDYGYPVADPVCHGHKCAQQFANDVLYSDMDQVDLRYAIDDVKGIPMENQSGRDTCSVMAMTVILQYGYTELCGAQTAYADFSEEYLNHVTNALPVNDGQLDGDVFERIAKGYEADGMIWETEWPFRHNISASDYNDNNIFFDDMISFDPTWTPLGHSLLIPGLHQDGHFIQPGDGDTISDFEFAEVLMYLRAGIPVAMGRAHSQVAVAYTANNGGAGGGTMVMRDSYGTGSAYGGETGGYNGFTFEQMKIGVPAKKLGGINDSYAYRRKMNTSITYGPVSVNVMGFDYALYGSEMVYLNDRAEIWAHSPALAKVVAGDAQSTDAKVNIGHNAQCEDILCRGHVTLRGATVSGAVDAQSIEGSGVEGTITTGTIEPFQILRQDPTFFEGMFNGAPDHFVERDQTFTMAPNTAYGNIFVRDGGTLVMDGAGEFYVNQLHVDAGGSVDMPASRQLERVVFYSPNSLTFSARAQILGNSLYMLWVTLGSNVYIGPGATFHGTILAPNAYINVDGRDGELLGAFLGRIVVTHQDSVIRHIPFWF